MSRMEVLEARFFEVFYRAIGSGMGIVDATARAKECIEKTTYIEDIARTAIKNALAELPDEAR